MKLFTMMAKVLKYLTVLENQLRYSIDFKAISNHVNYNKVSSQCHDTFVCGHYSIFYLFFRVRCLSFQEFMSLFSPICKMIDEYVVRFITHTFSFCLTNHL